MIDQIIIQKTNTLSAACKLLLALIFTIEASTLVFQSSTLAFAIHIDPDPCATGNAEAQTRPKPGTARDEEICLCKKWWIFYEEKRGAICKQNTVTWEKVIDYDRFPEEDTGLDTPPYDVIPCEAKIKRITITETSEAQKSVESCNGSSRKPEDTTCYSSISSNEKTYTSDLEISDTAPFFYRTCCLTSTTERHTVFIPNNCPEPNQGRVKDYNTPLSDPITTYPTTAECQGPESEQPQPQTQR